MTISNISLEHYLILAALIFSIGVTGLFMNRKSVITILMSIELMLLAVNINFVSFSVYLQDIVGQVFSLIILSIAAAEISIGLAILVLYFRNRGSIEIEDVNQMKG
jgi:NADH-quinone oxidoreductase subunit K